MRKGEAFWDHAVVGPCVYCFLTFHLIPFLTGLGRVPYVVVIFCLVFANNIMMTELAYFPKPRFIQCVLNYLISLAIKGFFPMTFLITCNISFPLFSQIIGSLSFIRFWVSKVMLLIHSKRSHRPTHGRSAYVEKQVWTKILSLKEEKVFEEEYYGFKDA